MNDRLIDRPFLALIAAHFLQALGYCSMLLLPLYLDWLGASRTEIGGIMATASVGGLASRPLVGWALDVLGRKPVLVVGTFVLVAGMAMVFAVTSVGPLVYLMRIIVGLGAGALFAGYFTFASDRIPASRRTEGLAIFGISGLAPLIVNPFADQIGIAPEDLRWFLPVVGVIVASSLVFLPMVPEVKADRSAAKVTVQSVRVALGHRSLWPVWLATGVFAGLVSVFMAFATVAAEGRGVENPAMVWLSYAGGAVLVRLVGAKLPERVGTGKVGAISLFNYAVGFWIAAGAQTTEGFVLAGLFCGLGHGYAFPVLAGQTVERSPKELRGMALSAFTGLWEVGRLFLAPLFGFIADTTSDGTMLRSAAIFGVVGLLAWGVLERAVQRKPES